ncbi:MAG: glycosyltransferase family 4 protein [Rhodobacteraceae bacterium]|nr:glycosyltransferase family 4 protein [Paracoccaceae bacterium]
MRILVLAPHPFYQERGTPIAVDLLVRALSERGDTVDVLTFHEGEDRSYEGVRIFRISAPPGVRNLRPGPSIKKLVCDLWLFFKLIRLLRRNRYDVLHCVEESVFMAMFLRPFFGFRYLYDMDSSLASQVVNKYRLGRPLRRLLSYLESLPMRRAEAVIPVCDALAELAEQSSARHVCVLRDVSLIDPTKNTHTVEDLRESLGIDGTITAYIGNLEGYQGIDLLLESFALVGQKQPNAHLIIIGGEERDIARYQNRSALLGITPRTHFLGKRPVEQMGAYLKQADVLVSPRTEGVNTPMKVYSYLHSGIPVLATDLPTHTQVMTPRIARLAPPSAEEFSAAWQELLGDPEARTLLGQEAREYIERQHSYASFRTTLHKLYGWLEGQVNSKHSVHHSQAPR